jgi:hypothetical protein
MRQQISMHMLTRAIASKVACMIFTILSGRTPLGVLVWVLNMSIPFSHSVFMLLFAAIQTIRNEP